MVTSAPNKILKQFPGMWIITNLIEKKFSALKKPLCFRGRRDADLWLEFLIVYYAIRDDPKLLEKGLESVEISFQMVIKALPALLTGGICV